MRGAGLVVISVLCGFFVDWVFRHIGNRAAIRAARKRVYARLLEFRLFADEPRLVLRAQWALLTDNLRLLRLVLVPGLIAAVPLAWIALQLESAYGYDPLAVGEAAVVTAQMDGDITADDLRSGLQASPGLTVETPPVRVFEDRQICWRIRAAKPSEGTLSVTLRGNTIEKSVAAGVRPIFVSQRRESSLFQHLLHPLESRISAPGVQWIEVDYPQKYWWIFWWLAFTTVSALAFGRYA